MRALEARAAGKQPFVRRAGTVNEIVFNALLRARVSGIGFEEGIASRVAAELLIAKRALLEEADRLRRSGERVLTSDVRQGLLDSVNRSLAVALNRASATIRRAAADLADKQASLLDGVVMNAQRAALPRAAAVGHPAVPARALLNRLGEPGAMGISLSKWTETFAFNVDSRTTTALARVAQAGGSVDDAYRAVRDTIDGAADSDLRTLARTVLSQRSADMDEEFFRANADVIDGVQWVATLDERTCPICIPLDGETFKIDDDTAPKPPQHTNCRCVLVPWFDDDTVVGTRAAGGPERADVPERMTFSEWLPTQGADVQREVLGPTRASLWKSGKLDLEDFAGPAGILTLDQLSERHGKTVRAAIERLRGSAPTRPRTSRPVAGEPDEGLFTTTF